MKTIILDISNIYTVKALHIYLAYMLVLPAHYGKNLDALYDILTERGEETVLRVLESDRLESLLGSYGALLLSTLQEAAEDNPALTVELL